MNHTFEADLGFLPKILVSSSTTTEETFPCGPWLWAFVLRKTLTCSLYALTIEVIQLFQLRLSPEQSGKVEYVTKFIHLLAIPSSLSRSYSTFPLCSGITLIEIVVYLFDSGDCCVDCEERCHWYLLFQVQAKCDRKLMMAAQKSD